MRILNYDPKKYTSSIHSDVSISSKFVDGIEVVSFVPSKAPEPVSADMFSLSSMLEAGVDLSHSKISTDSSNRIDDMKMISNLPIDDILKDDSNS